MHNSPQANNSRNALIPLTRLVIHLAAPRRSPAVFRRSHTRFFSNTTPPLPRLCAASRPLTDDVPKRTKKTYKSFYAKNTPFVENLAKSNARTNFSRPTFSCDHGTTEQTNNHAGSGVLVFTNTQKMKLPTPSPRANFRSATPTRHPCAYPIVSYIIHQTPPSLVPQGPY